MKKITKQKINYKNKKNYTNKNFYVIICFALLLIVLVFLLYRTVSPFYKVESRIKKFNSEEKKRSQNLIGWIKVQGTNIDYPVILQDDVTDVTADLGYEYAWTNQETKFLTNRPIIYGHNFLNLSSNPEITNPKHSGFEQLLSYIYPSFIKDNKYIQYTVGGKDYIYKIFSISFVKTDDTYPFNNQLDKDDYKQYIKDSKEDSYFDFDVDVASDDEIITLVTCTRFFDVMGYSFKIDGRLVRNNELVSNYRFKEKKNYNEIKKILEGDEENEKA